MGQGEIVRDEDDGCPRLPIERLEQLDDVRTGVAVQIARGLIGEEEARGIAERARNGHALLLASGELIGKVVRPVTEPHAGQQLARPRWRAILAAQFERHLHVLERGERRDELEALKHEPDLLAPELRAPVFVQLRQVGAVQEYSATRRDVESGEEAEQCSFPTP